jgi:hypothetical protein
MAPLDAALDSLTAAAPASAPGRAAKTRGARALWRVAALHLGALALGVGLGSVLILLTLKEPAAPSLSGAVAPGEERLVAIPWPAAAVLDGQAPYVAVDLAVSPRIADEAAVAIELIDPDNPAARFLLGRLDALDGAAVDGLIVHQRTFDLEPHLRTLRGAVRQIDVETVQLVLRVERLSGQRVGYVYLTAAAVLSRHSPAVVAQRRSGSTASATALRR